MDGHVVPTITPADIRLVDAFHRCYLSIGDQQYGQIDDILWIIETDKGQIDASIETAFPADGQIRLRSWPPLAKGTKITAVVGWVEGVGSFELEPTEPIILPEKGSLRLTIDSAKGLRLTIQ